MGDRANIIVKADGEQVCLYTHWDGSELDTTLKVAMRRGSSRWNDFQYLTRIIFCEMIKSDVNGITGYGITQKPHDGVDRIITVDCDNQTVKVCESHAVSFSDFVQ